MSAGVTSSQRTAICFLNPGITTDRAADERAMIELAARLGYDTDEPVIINPYRMGPYVTVMTAISEQRPAAVIVPDLDHVDGIDRYIRERVLLITVAGERVLERGAVA